MLSSVPAYAGVELIVVERPFHAHHLAGTIVDSTGFPLSGVSIDICDWPYTPHHFENVPQVVEGDCNENPAHVLASATTDANGRFSFPNLSMRATPVTCT